MPFFRFSKRPPGNITLGDEPYPRAPATTPTATIESKEPVAQVSEIPLSPVRDGLDSHEPRPSPDSYFPQLSSTVAASIDRGDFASSPSPSPTSPLHRDRADSLGFSPIRHIATTYRIRSARPKKSEYGRLPSDDDEGGLAKLGNVVGRDSDGDDCSDTYYVDEDTLVSQGLSRGRGRRWLVCGIVCGLTLLAILLVLNVLVYASRSVYGIEADPDAIFSNWGLPGTGTAALAWYPTDFLRDVVPIPCHSHNDYWRKVPLFSALHAGCIGTEADVWLVDGDLQVGHKRAALTPNRTFQSLYVDPLVKILAAQNPSSADQNETATAPRGVFDMAPNQTLALLVDVKTDGAATFRKVLEQVEPLRARGWLSTFADGQVRYGPVTLVASGNTPFDVVTENATYRYAFFDAPLAALDNSAYDTTNSYYASVALARGVGRVWFGGVGRGQRRHMHAQLQQAHARGLQARYWSLPAWPIGLRNAVWTTLVAEGVDLLNVDDIQAATHADWTK